MHAWNNWYHCMCNTYGTWLRGDPRGWRTRHHRENVEGDYKNRPASGTWERTYALSKSLMERPPVHLSNDLRDLALTALVASLPYWTRTAPSGPLQATMDSALNPAWGNTAQNMATIRVPAGTTIYEGFAAPQGNLLGGGSQVYIPKVNPNWVVPNP